MLMTVWATDPAGGKHLVIDKILPGMGERIVTSLAVVHPDGEFWLEPFDRNRKTGRGEESGRGTRVIQDPESHSRPPLTEVIAGALVASLQKDEPNWPAPRNWDACGSRVIGIHAANIAAAVQKSHDVYQAEGLARFDR